MLIRNMSALKNPMLLPVAAGLVLVGLPYCVSLTLQWMYGWPDKPGYKKYTEALKPRRIYRMTKSALENLKCLQHVRLFFQAKSWYGDDRNRKHYEKGVPFGRRGQKLDLYFPPSVSGFNGGPPPLVVFIYGGAWGSGDRSMYCLLARRMCEELRAAVVCPDYCIYPRGNVLGMVQDIADCLIWARESGPKFNFDKDKIVLVGHSAGAHLGVLTALFLSDEREELFIEAGLHRELAQALRGVIGLGGVYNIPDHYEHEQKRAVEYVSTMHRAMGGVENFAYYSPAHMLQELRRDKLSRLPPFALLHGSDDVLAPAESASKFSALLGRLSAEASLYVLPGLDHLEVVVDLMSPDRRHYNPIYSCIKLECRKFNVLHP